MREKHENKAIGRWGRVSEGREKDREKWREMGRKDRGKSGMES